MSRELNRNHFRALLAMLMIALAMLCLCGAAQSAYANDSIGTITVNEETKAYTDYGELRSDLEALKYQTVEVEMTSDWNARDGGSGILLDEHLVIPVGSFVTLNMNGHMIDRGLTGKAYALAHS